MSAKDSLMTAAVALDDITVRLSSLAKTLLEASRAMPRSTRGSIQDFDAIAAWEDAHREPEATPPPDVADAIIESLAECHQRAWALRDRVEALPDASKMRTLIEIIDGHMTSVKEVMMAAVWTTQGQPTSVYQLDRRHLDREPISRIVGDREYAIQALPLGTDAKGRTLRAWNLEVKPVT